MVISLDRIRVAKNFWSGCVVGCGILILFFSSCSHNQNSEKNALFQLIDVNKAGIDFENRLSYTDEFNIFTYRNFYNGGGAAIGDINNDGLPDIYFTANQGPNQLYLNKGNFQFENITQKAGVSGHGSWSTGVTMTDVNGDGWLDIYVCNSGNFEESKRRNELFINQGNLTFVESAKKYGLDNDGFTNHATFFDYDRDGDLDVYLVNNSFLSPGSIDPETSDRLDRDPMGGDRLLRNDDNYFSDVSREANIYGSVIGFGLATMISDFNNDGWPDIYVCNDFFERDYIYMNNGDGTFEEDLPAKMQSINQASMGVDAADITGDGYPEIFVTEMLPKSDERFKTTMIYEDWESYLFNLEHDYYHQFTRNTLQLNNKETSASGISFSEIGRLADVEATDWSWSGLIVDLDNNGFKDIYVTNGIYQDILDQEFLNRISNDLVFRDIFMQKKINYKKLIEAIPSNPIANFAFSGGPNYHFADSSLTWGLATPGFSNGAAYGDLDNDGDLDLVVNNVNMEPFVYRNTAEQKHPENRYLKLKLKGIEKNTSAIGAKVKVYEDGWLHQLEQMPSRGFQSSMDFTLHFGLGEVQTVDSVIVYWPKGNISKLFEIAADQTIEISEEESLQDFNTDGNNLNFDFIDATQFLPDNLSHQESTFNDFKNNALLFHMNTSEGAGLAVGDVNGDGLDDVYICGASGSPGKLFTQNRSGGFRLTEQPNFEINKESEEINAHFFDADGDADPDLYVTSGSDEFALESRHLKDHLYFNDGNGNFTESQQVFPTVLFESTSCVTSCDFDQDGDPDLFVGVRLENGFYGKPQNGYLLENDGTGFFTNVTQDKAPGLIGLGMIKDATWADYNGDGQVDLIVVGEWMTIRIFQNSNGRLTDVTEKAGLSNYNGWWNVVEAADLDNDGDVDLVVGNHGLNTQFKASFDQPITMHVNDFDNNGVVEHIVSKVIDNKHIPFTQIEDLKRQIPSLIKVFKETENYGSASIEDLFEQKQLSNSLTLRSYFMETAVFMNDGHGTFTVIALPMEAQFSPVYAVQVYDINGDGNKDLLLGGNLYEVKPEVGRYDASYGLFLKGLGDGTFKAIENSHTGLNIQEQVRDIEMCEINGKKEFLFSVINGKVHAYRWKQDDL